MEGGFQALSKTDLTAGFFFFFVKVNCNVHSKALLNNEDYRLLLWYINAIYYTRLFDSFPSIQ